MKLTNRLLIGAAFGLLPAFAFATIAPVHLTNPSATFSNTVPSSGQNVTYHGDSNQEVRWGVPFQQPSPGEQSGLRFDVFSAPYDAAIDSPFDLGTLTHFNFPIGIPTVKTTDLAFSFDTSAGTSSFLFNLGIEETPNSGTCAYGSDGDTPCPDKISFASPQSSETFNIGGVDYTLEILGFGPTSDNLMESFISQEGGQNEVQLFAKITAATPPVNVPEPNALLLMAFGLLALGGAVQLGKRKQAKKENDA